MPRPKNKTDLISLSNANFQKLNELVDSFSPEELKGEFPPQYMNRNVRDILAHLHHWHLMMLEWYEVGMSGDKPDMPAKGYTWKTVPDLNRRIWEKYRQTKLVEIRKDLEESFKAIQDLIDKHSDEELFEKKKYKWTGSTSLGAYLISATSSHYDWALKIIKQYKKSQ